MKKEYRIKKNQEIASIVSNKNKVANKNFLIYYQKSDQNQMRIAFSVYKKYGKAFERNKAIRIARNIFRKYVKEKPGYNLVVVIKPISKQAKYLELQSEAEFLMKLIGKKNNGGINEKQKL